MAKHRGKSSSSGVGHTGASTSTTATERERRVRIAELAYQRAAARGFQGGDPVNDWLEAEREINRLMPKPQQQKDDLAAYDKLRQLIRERLADAREGMSAATLHDALDRARAKLRDAGEHTVDTVERVAATAEKEMADTVRRMGPTWHSMTEKTGDVFVVWRDRGATFLGHAAGAAADWLKQAGTRLERPIYRTGEMTAAGAFECTACGQRVELETPAHLPPCPGCQKTEYRRL